MAASRSNVLVITISSLAPQEACVEEEPQWVVVATFRSAEDAEQTAHLLHGAGIPVMVHGEKSGLFEPGDMGWAAGHTGVSVPTKKSAEATALILESA